MITEPRLSAQTTAVQLRGNAGGKNKKIEYLNKKNEDD
jgi:hypothetical protein